MEKTQIALLEVSPQERLAWAWALRSSAAVGLPVVTERRLDEARRATHLLSAPEAWEFLSEVPALWA
jgi:hypothetical protein